METALQTYADKDTGFRQFCDRYSYVAGNDETREQYFRWRLDVMRQEGIKYSGWLEGISEGELRKLVRLIQRKKQNHSTREQIIQDLMLEESDIEILDNFESYKHLL